MLLEEGVNCIAVAWQPVVRDSLFDDHNIG